MKKSSEPIKLNLKTAVLLCAACVFATVAIIYVGSILLNKNKLAVLPEHVAIQILNYGIDDSSALILGTEPGDGLAGRWSMMSNPNSGSFIDTRSALTTFRGGLFENYLLRWTISNGVEEVFAEEMVNIGKNFTLAQLLNAGVDIDTLSEKYSIRELIDAEVPLKKLVDRNISAEKILAAGADAGELLEAGAATRNIIGAGVPVLELSGNFSKEELIEAGIIAKIPDADLLVLKYFNGKFNPADAAEFCENLTVGGVENWRLPTIEELRKIYEFKNMLGYSNENWFEMFWSSTFSHYGTDENGTLPNYWTKNMEDGDESTYYGFEKRIIPVADDEDVDDENYK